MSFHDRIPQLLTIAHPLSPIIIIIAFLIAFLTHSLSSAKTSQCHPSRTQQTGPNGKPLPRRLSPDRCRSPVESSALPDFSPGARSTFRWLNLLILITYVIDAANTVSHAIISRKEHWWCGQSLVVCLRPSNSLPLSALYMSLQMTMIASSSTMLEVFSFTLSF